MQVIFSAVSMGVGFQWLVSGGGCAKWTTVSALLSLLSFFTFVVTVSYISFLGAKDTFDFIPASFFPSKSEVNSLV